MKPHSVSDRTEQIEQAPSRTVLRPAALEAPRSMEQIVESLNICPEQQKLMMENIKSLSRRDNSNASEPIQERNKEEIVCFPATSVSFSAQAVALLSPQIPEFGGMDEKNVLV